MPADTFHASDRLYVVPDKRRAAAEQPQGPSGARGRLRAAGRGQLYAAVDRSTSLYDFLRLH